MKSSFCIDLQRFMLIPTKFPLSPGHSLTTRWSLGEHALGICCPARGQRVPKIWNDFWVLFKHIIINPLSERTCAAFI